VTLPGPGGRRTRALLNRPATVVDGYLDVMGAAEVPQTTGQRVMGSSVLPMIYERLWRPVLFFGFTARNSAQEDRRKLRLLDLHPGDTVLDVACGPGNTTRTLLAAVGSDGLAVGVDSSATMLSQAVRDTTPGTPVGYVRADAVDLPFDDGTVETHTNQTRFTHTFPRPGAYRVQASVTDNLGKTYRWTQSVRIDSPLSAAVDQTTDNGKHLLTVRAVGGQRFDVVAAHWTFSDGTTADGPSISRPLGAVDGAVTIVDGAGNSATTAVHVS
jgi:SAM-dependent methyltransferase